MKKTIFYLALSFAIVGCTNDNDNDLNDNNNNSNEETAIIPKRIVRFDQESLTNETNYEAVDGKVQKITNTEFQFHSNNVPQKKTETSITYANNLPVSEKVIDLINNKTIRETSYEYAAGKLVKAVSKIEEDDKPSVMETKTYKYEGDNLKESSIIAQSPNSTRRENKIFNYISDTEIQVFYSYEEAPFTRKDTVIYTLDSKKRIIKSVSDNPSSRVTYHYIYDDKNNYKRIPLFVTTNPEHFIDGELAQNNLLRRKENYFYYANVPGENEYFVNQRNEYQYNEKDYPIKVNGADIVNHHEEHPYTIEITY